MAIYETIYCFGYDIELHLWFKGASGSVMVSLIGCPIHMALCHIYAKSLVNYYTSDLGSNFRFWRMWVILSWFALIRKCIYTEWTSRKLLIGLIRLRGISTIVLLFNAKSSLYIYIYYIYIYILDIYDLVLFGLVLCISTIASVQS